jgi:geranylgeranyl reductase
VGADGSNSLVRRYLGLKSKFLGIGIYYIVENLKKDVEIHFNSKLFNAWYGWIFPYEKDSVTIGTAAFGKILPIYKAKKNLESWLESCGFKYDKEKFFAHPINCDYRGYKFGNVFLVGDAAGLASPFTGEGIYQSLVSGEVVGKQIIDAKYSTSKIRDLRCMQRTHYFFVYLLWLLGPLRGIIFGLVTFVVKNKYIARILLWFLA